MLKQTIQYTRIVCCVQEDICQTKVWLLRFTTDRMEKIARLTTCLCDPTLPEDVAYVDTNNCPWAVAFLEENGLAEKTGRTKRSGYCVYPAMRFNREKIAQFEEEEN